MHATVYADVLEHRTDCSNEMMQHRAANQEEVKATCSAVLCNAVNLLDY
jgi:hypothetical protein